MSEAPIPEIEPTPEFNARCLAIIQEWQSGDLPFPEANQRLAALEREAISTGHVVNQGRVEQLLGYMKGYRGDLNAAIYHYERARALYNLAGNQRRVAICDLNMGEAFRYKGDFKRARLLFEKAYQTFRAVGDQGSEAMAIGNKGQMHLSMGQLDTARADLEESCRIARQLSDSDLDRNGQLCEVHQALALLHLKSGDTAAAWREAHQAYQIADQTGQPLEQGFANRAIAEVLTAIGDAPENGFSSDPDAYYQASSEAFAEINAEGEIARTMFAQAISLARRGRRMTAARKLQLAMSIFTRLGMVDDAAKAAEAQLEVL
ncbi:MAG: tetratricopeptide repeat protein [Chloroflexi bacterium]|nr:tetratricopeptide repeat protein [Chloroflexota bacterium]